MFTTRPELIGSFGVVASSHWIASQAAMRMLELGGNAFDAAVAGGLVLQVAEPQLNGPGGDLPVLLWRADLRAAQVICGQGPAPMAATIPAMTALGIDLIPGTGLLPAVVPGAFDAWMLLLRDHGSMTLAEVLEPAIHYAETGVPVGTRLAATLQALERLYTMHWTSSAAVYLKDGVPAPGTLLANPTLAATWRRLLAEAGSGDRVAGIEAARRAWRQGFVAEAIDRFCRGEPVMDITGRAHRGFLTGEDMARWSATVEQPVALDHDGMTVLKTGPWSQGPVMLQMLRLLEGSDIAAMDPAGPDFVHLLAEAGKLAFADRETFYADPLHVDVPLARLLSAGYAAERRALIGATASASFRPGSIPGHGHPPDFAAALTRRRDDGVLAAYGAGEPTLARLPAAGPEERRPLPLVGDTCTITVADRHGNLVAATPSGGWLQASPVIPELGFCLGTRGQSFWLDPRAPNALAPGKRPRTTLTPTLVLRDGEGWLACGSPGGDQQDQWQTQMLLRHRYHGMNLQAAIDFPSFHVEQWPGSFYPRPAVPQALKLEERFPPATVAALRARGHAVSVVEPWSEGRLCAVRIEGRTRRAAASPRGMQAYAVGR
ncbi:MAG: gamma-glutamyltransferase family protein [Thalassobaculales bacterium]